MFLPELTDMVNVDVVTVVFFSLGPKHDVDSDADVDVDGHSC